MNTPDKIYIVPDFIEGLSLERKDYDDEVCYIRKDSLIEWLENKIKIPDVSFINGLTYLAYKDVIEHINEM